MITNHVKYLKIRRYIYIITDNRQAFDWIAGDADITESYIFDMFNCIYTDIYSLNTKYSIVVFLIWCPETNG